MVQVRAFLADLRIKSIMPRKRRWDLHARNSINSGYSTGSYPQGWVPRNEVFDLIWRRRLPEAYSVLMVGMDGLPKKMRRKASSAACRVHYFLGPSGCSGIGFSG